MGLCGGGDFTQPRLGVVRVNGTCLMKKWASWRARFDYLSPARSRVVEIFLWRHCFLSLSPLAFTYFPRNFFAPPPRIVSDMDCFASLQGLALARLNSFTVRKILFHHSTVPFMVAALRILSTEPSSTR